MTDTKVTAEETQTRILTQDVSDYKCEPSKLCQHGTSASSSSLSSLYERESYYVDSELDNDREREEGSRSRSSSNSSQSRTKIYSLKSESANRRHNVGYLSPRNSNDRRNGELPIPPPDLIPAPAPFGDEEQYQRQQFDSSCDRSSARVNGNDNGSDRRSRRSRHQIPPPSSEDQCRKYDANNNNENNGKVDNHKTRKDNERDSRLKNVSQTTTKAKNSRQSRRKTKARHQRQHSSRCDGQSSCDAACEDLDVEKIGQSDKTPRQQNLEFQPHNSKTQPSYANQNPHRQRRSNYRSSRRTHNYDNGHEQTSYSNPHHSVPDHNRPFYTHPIGESQIRIQVQGMHHPGAPFTYSVPPLTSMQIPMPMSIPMQPNQIQLPQPVPIMQMVPAPVPAPPPHPLASNANFHPPQTQWGPPIENAYAPYHNPNVDLDPLSHHYVYPPNNSIEEGNARVVEGFGFKPTTYCIPTGYYDLDTLPPLPRRVVQPSVIYGYTFPVQNQGEGVNQYIVAQSHYQGNLPVHLNTLPNGILQYPIPECVAACNYHQHEVPTPASIPTENTDTTLDGSYSLVCINDNHSDSFNAHANPVLPDHYNHHEITLEHEHIPSTSEETAYLEVDVGPTLELEPSASETMMNAGMATDSKSLESGHTFQFNPKAAIFSPTPSSQLQVEIQSQSQEQNQGLCDNGEESQCEIRENGQNIRFESSLPTISEDPIHNQHSSKVEVEVTGSEQSCDTQDSEENIEIERTCEPDESQNHQQIQCDKESVDHEHEPVSSGGHGEEIGTELSAGQRLKMSVKEATANEPMPVPVPKPRLRPRVPRPSEIPINSDYMSERRGAVNDARSSLQQKIKTPAEVASEMNIQVEQWELNKLNLAAPYFKRFERPEPKPKPSVNLDDDPNLPAWIRDMMKHDDKPREIPTQIDYAVRVATKTVSTQFDSDRRSPPQSAAVSPSRNTSFRTVASDGTVAAASPGTRIITNSNCTYASKVNSNLGPAVDRNSSSGTIPSSSTADSLKSKPGTSKGSWNNVASVSSTSNGTGPGPSTRASTNPGTSTNHQSGHHQHPNAGNRSNPQSSSSSSGNNSNRNRNNNRPAPGSGTGTGTGNINLGRRTKGKGARR